MTSLSLHKEFTWPDFGREYIPIYPHPVDTPLLVKIISVNFGVG